MALAKASTTIARLLVIIESCRGAGWRLLVLVLRGSAAHVFKIAIARGVKFVPSTIAYLAKMLSVDLVQTADPKSIVFSQTASHPGLDITRSSGQNVNQL